ncbi:MAG: Hsp20/alpha crystallin family protein [Galactobacillus timonensis]|uniref:Hsp20/alpha crystallin family protein n=1 Tax=Galactobacillus timonensis TaxID=2041840 RepID=UPI0024096DAE|nr:Hsp20/alpha crystallin family protein [Galactobacillus timonensis]MDD6599234.1 Hsp20/alpha crystallin family protein [Galactobacillus timonensis]
MKYTPVRREFDDLFDDDWFGAFGGKQLMRTDVREKDGKYFLDIELPGYKKEDVKVQLSDGTLTVTAAHNESSEEKDKKGNVIRQERYTGNASRSWYVGDGVKQSDVHANFKDGVLTIEVPDASKAVKEPEYIAIE